MNEVIDSAPPVLAAAQHAQAGALAHQQAAGAIQGAGAAMPQQPLSVIEQAIRTGATADQLERLLQLQVQADHHRLDLMREQRRMAEEDRKLFAKLAFDAAMSKLRGHNVIIPKTKEVVQTARGGGAGPRFWQSEYDVVCQMLSPALADCGLGFRHDMQFGQREWKADGSNPDVPAGTLIYIPWVTVTCHLTHCDGHTESLMLEGPPDTSGSKNPLQEMQSSASYLKRQSLLAITGTATGGEDDEAAMRRRRQHGKEPAGADAATGPDETLLDAGRAEAMKGVAALNKWWGSLTAKDRSALQSEFRSMRRAAEQADKETAHG